MTDDLSITIQALGTALLEREFKPQAPKPIFILGDAMVAVREMERQMVRSLVVRDIPSGESVVVPLAGLRGVEAATGEIERAIADLVRTKPAP